MTALPKPVREINEAYRSWVKTQPCSVIGWYDTFGPCAGPIDPHHVIPQGGGKTGSKVSDLRVIPLCRVHHDLATRRPEFFRNFCNPEQMILRLNAQYTPKPKPPRSITPSVKLLLIKCDCGRTHRIAASKTERVATVDYRGVRYYCMGKMKGWKVATWG